MAHSFPGILRMCDPFFLLYCKELAHCVKNFLAAFVMIAGMPDSPRAIPGASRNAPHIPSVA
jgi:hypothetical protein